MKIFGHGSHNYNCKNPEGDSADRQRAPYFPVHYVSDDEVKHDDPAFELYLVLKL